MKKLLLVVCLSLIANVAGAGWCVCPMSIDEGPIVYGCYKSTKEQCTDRTCSFNPSNIQPDKCKVKLHKSHKPVFKIHL